MLSENRTALEHENIQLPKLSGAGFLSYVNICFVPNGMLCAIAEPEHFTLPALKHPGSQF